MIHLLRRIPLYGQLIDANRTSLKGAAIDLLISIIFSLMPIWLFPLIVSATFKEENNIWELMYEFSSNGEFFIYAAALVGPLIYAISKRYGAISITEKSPTSSFPVSFSISFPYGLAFILISFLVCLIAALVFCFLRLEFVGFISKSIDTDFLLKTSFYIYIFTLSCHYAVSVYKLELENAVQGFGNDTSSLWDQWSKRDA